MTYIFSILSVMKKLFFITMLAALILSCSKESNNSESIKSYTTPAKVQEIQENKHNTTIKASFIKGANNHTGGDFTEAYFQVENYSNNILLTDKMDCTDTGKSIDCLAVTDLYNLKPGIYRVIIKSSHGLLGSDLFEIMPNIIPVVITIDNESTGFYLISMIIQQTGFNENEIYKRVAHILSVDAEEFDLEVTLYDLLMYYGGSSDFPKAMRIINEKLQKNEPIQIDVADGISGTLKPIF